jgi:hypothetical protein
MLRRTSSLSEGHGLTSDLTERRIGGFSDPVSRSSREQTPAPLTRVRWSVILVALALIPFNARLVNEIETIRFYAWPSYYALPLNVVAYLALLVSLNIALKRWAPRWALNQAELLVVYSMLAVGTVIAGWAFVSMVFSYMLAPAYCATPQNQYEDIFLWHLPNWLVVKDEAAVSAIRFGQHSFWERPILLAWIRPLGAWILFLMALMGAMACISVIVRRRWTDYEHLTFPVVQLPLALTRPDAGLLRSRLFWTGFGLSAGLAMLKGFGYFYPALPGPPSPLFLLGDFFRTFPWNAMTYTPTVGGGLPVDFYPWVIGFGVLMPKDVLFSYWFFFWFLRAEEVVVAATGYQGVIDTNYIRKELFGALLAVAPFVIWSGRHYLKAVWQRAVYKRGALDDQGEPISYRAALAGMLLCILIMAAIARAAGMSLLAVTGMLAVFFAITLSIIRARAEIGGTGNEMAGLWYDELAVSLLGPRGLNPRDLSVLSLFSWSGAAIGLDPTPHQIEAFKMAQTARFDMRRLFAALALASIVGLVAAFVTLIAPTYAAGAENATTQMQWGIDRATDFSYTRLSHWLTTADAPRSQTTSGLIAMGCGFVFSLILYALRGRYLWFPFHPLGFVMAGNWNNYRFWPSILVAWMAKVLLMRYGGLRGYLAALPFCFGLIVGDAIGGTGWIVAGMILNTGVYSMWGAE